MKVCTRSPLLIFDGELTTIPEVSKTTRSSTRRHTQNGMFHVTAPLCTDVTQVEELDAEELAEIGQDPSAEDEEPSGDEYLPPSDADEEGSHSNREDNIEEEVVVRRKRRQVVRGA